MDLTLHDVTYNEDTIEVYELDDMLVFYATEKIGSKAVCTHIRLNKNAQIELYKALDKHLYYDEWGGQVEGLESYDECDEVMIDAEKLLKLVDNEKMNYFELTNYLNAYIDGQKGKLK